MTPASPSTMPPDVAELARRLRTHLGGSLCCDAADLLESLSAASAALAARCVPREPTVAMLRVDIPHYACGGMMSGCQLGEVWRTMYDAAIASQAEGETK